MAKRRRNGKVRQVSPLTEWPPKLQDSVAEVLNYTMICRRASKFEPLLRFNPQNWAKIVCFAGVVKGAKCVFSDYLNEKLLVILNCIILKIKAQLK